MRRTVISTLVTQGDDARPDDTLRTFAALLEILDSTEGDVELVAESTHLRLSTAEVAILRDLFSAAAAGRSFVMHHSASPAADGQGSVVLYSFSDVPQALLAHLEGADQAPASMSSQQVADVLNVSRPFVVKLARSGELRHTKVGNRHRFTAADVAAYAEKMRSERETALREMVPEGGYTADDF